MKQFLIPGRPVYICRFQTVFRDSGKSRNVQKHIISHSLPCIHNHQAPERRGRCSQPHQIEKAKTGSTSYGRKRFNKNKLPDKPTYKDEELRINKERQMLVNVGDIVLLNCMSTVDVFDAIDFDGKTIRKFMFVNPNFISVKYATTRTTTRK